MSGQLYTGMRTWLPQRSLVPPVALHSRSFPCSLKIMFPPEVGRCSRDKVMRPGTSEMLPEIETLRVGVSPLQRKAPPKGERNGRRQGLVCHEPRGQKPRHISRLGPAQAPKIHTAVCPTLFGPSCPVPQVPLWRLWVFPPMAWYSLLRVSPSAITNNELTLALPVGPDKQNSSTSFPSQKELPIQV